MASPLEVPPDLTQLARETRYQPQTGVVTATGMETEFGKIAKLLQTVEETDTPLQQNLDRVGKILARAGLVVAYRHFGTG